MAALAPVFLSTLKASNNTGQRSTANSLAVEASEQLRSFPYYQLGYYSTDEPTGCSSLAPSLDEVILSPSVVPSEPLVSLPTNSSIGHVGYGIERCVYWVNSTVSGDTDAYKESIVRISWSGATGPQSLTLTSALYPGGQKGYAPQNDLVPNQASSANCTGTAPGQPSNVTASDDLSAPTNTIDVSWTASDPPADYYVVLYTDYENPGVTEIDQVVPTGDYSISPETTATYDQITVSPGQTWYVQVQAVACGTPSTADNTASATTQGTATTTTTTAAGGSTPTTVASTNPGGCIISGLTTNPASTPSSEVSVSSGSLEHTPTNQITLTGQVTSGTCSNVYVAWAPSGCTPDTSRCSTSWTPMNITNGTLSASMGTPKNGQGGGGGDGTSWAAPATLQFVLYFGQGSTATTYQPSTAANVLTCQYNGGTSGKSTSTTAVPTCP